MFNSLSREREDAVLLRDYVNQRLDEGENNAMIEGLQNSVRCNLVDAVNNVPRADWEAEISSR